MIGETMNKWYTIFYSALFVEITFLIFSCVLRIYYLLCGLIISNIDTLSIMTKVASPIAIIIIPLETALFRHYLRKQKEPVLYANIPKRSEEEKIHRFFQIVISVFVVLWFAHGFVFSIIVEGRMNLRRGSDMYMFLAKPGNINILLSAIGIIIADFILYGTHANVKRRY